MDLAAMDVCFRDRRDRLSFALPDFSAKVKTANILIHESQFPENVCRDLLESLRTRRVNHKFHYDSVRQTQKWLALHQIYSPTRNDEDCRAIYEKSFEPPPQKQNQKTSMSSASAAVADKKTRGC